MIKDDKRVRLFIGHYGSGKSEVSINYVTKLRKEVDGEVSRRYVSGTICRSRKQIRRRWWPQFHQNKRLVDKSNGDTNHILQGIR